MKLTDIFKKFVNIIKNNIAISVILLFSFLVRWYGIYFDYPHGSTFIWDEVFGLMHILNIIESKNIFIQGNSYPAFLNVAYVPVLFLRLIYLAIVNWAFNLGQLKSLLVEGGMGQIYIIIRWYSVFFGTATVFLIYKIYHLIFKNKIVANFAALSYAFSLLAVTLSHWGKAHSAMAFFVVLSLYLVLRFQKTDNIKYFYGSVIAAACSVSTHYLGIAALIFPFVGFLYKRKLFTLKRFSLSALYFTLITAFFYLFNFKGVRQYFIDVNNLYYEKTEYAGLMKVSLFERFTYPFRDSFNLEPIFMTLFFVILVLAIKKYVKNKYLRYVFWGLVFDYFLMSFVIVGPRMTRWMLVFLTLAVPSGAAVLSDYLIGKKINKKLFNAIMLMLVLPSIFITFKWLTLFNSDTRLDAVDWLTENVSKGKYVYSFSGYFDAPLSYEAAKWNKENNDSRSKKIDLILNNPEKFKDAGLNLMYDKSHNRYQELAGNNTEYMVITYWLVKENGGLVNFPLKWQEYELLDKVREYHDLELVKTFYPTTNEKLIETGMEDYLNNPISWGELMSLDKTGPFTEIYKVN